MTAHGQFETIVSRMLQIRGEVLDAMSPETVSAWDSFNALMLISELEKGFNVKFSSSDLSAMKTIGDIKTILRSKQVNI